MEVNAHDSRRAVFSVVHTTLVDTQWCCKHISVAVNRHATIEETVFSVGAAPRLCNEDRRQLRDRIELSTGVGSYSREMRELAVDGD
jgi:hypothetical protein